MRAARVFRGAATQLPKTQYSWGSWTPLIEWSAPGGASLQIHQPASEEVFSSGFKVWPASSVIAGYLIERGLVRGARILELGCGTGALGLSCAAAGAKSVVLTERVFNDSQPSRRYLDLLETNARQNAEATKGTEVFVEKLDFQKESDIDDVLEKHGPFDLVIGCEMMYDEVLHPPIARTLAKLNAAHETRSMQAFLCQRMRIGPETLMEALSEIGLEGHVVHTEGGEPPIGVLRIVEEGSPDGVSQVYKA